MIFKGVIRFVDIFTFRHLIRPDTGILHEESLWAGPTNKNKPINNLWKFKIHRQSYIHTENMKTEIFVVL